VSSTAESTELVNEPANNSDIQKTSFFDSMSHAWRALRHRNFQLFFAGQSVSLIGTWMTRLATSWLVYRLTHSALLLGIVSFAGQIVSFALGPFAGVWVERLDRRKLLVWTQAAAAVQSLALAGLTGAYRHPVGNHRSHCLSGVDQCARHACPPIFPRTDGRGPQRPQ
jgi:transmembrane secretion effector